MTDGSAGPVLDYRAAGDRDGVPPARRSWAFRVALFCWLGTLAAVLSTVAAAIAVGPRPMERIGVSMFMVGAPASFVGAIAAATFAAKRWAVARNPWRECALPAVGLILLQVSNYAVAFGCILIVDRNGW